MKRTRNISQCRFCSFFRSYERVRVRLGQRASDRMDCILRVRSGGPAKAHPASAAARGAFPAVAAIDQECGAGGRASFV